MKVALTDRYTGEVHTESQHRAPRGLQYARAPLPVP